MSRTRRRIVAHARENRRNMGKAEGLVWWSIRRRLLGYHFRRQHPMGPFIADFACLEERLIVEIDGAHHSAVRDKARDEWFVAHGFRTLRIDEADVLERLDDVLGWITGEIEAPR